MQQPRISVSVPNRRNGGARFIVSLNAELKWAIGRIFTIGWMMSGILLSEKKTPLRNNSIGKVMNPANGPALSGFFAIPEIMKPSSMKASVPRMMKKIKAY